MAPSSSISVAVTGPQRPSDMEVITPRAAPPRDRGPAWALFEHGRRCHFCDDPFHWEEDCPIRLAQYLEREARKTELEERKQKEIAATKQQEAVPLLPVVPGPLAPLTPTRNPGPIVRAHVLDPAPRMNQQ